MNKKTSPTSQKGISLLELLIVLAAGLILATFAVAQFSSSKKNLERQNIVRELKVSFERARADSVKRRAVNPNEMANVTINNAVSFSLATDLNQSGTIDFAEVKQINFADSGIRFVGNNLNFPITIRFDRRGFINATNGIGAAVFPNFTICENCTTSTVNAENSNTVSISPTGTVLITAGGENLPTFENPEVSAVSVGSQINQSVTVTPSPQSASTPPPCTVILILCI